MEGMLDANSGSDGRRYLALITALKAYGDGFHGGVRGAVYHGSNGARVHPRGKRQPIDMGWREPAFDSSAEGFGQAVKEDGLGLRGGLEVVPQVPVTVDGGCTGTQVELQ